MNKAEQLADAEAQYHLLVTGQQAKVFVDQNGERVEYTAANRADLQKYITRLKTELRGPNLSGPMRVFM
ncbi:gpW family head-tail joining protein [Sulfitobacter pontiacus]